ncbi:unnamed protein product [Alternaria alternata]
MRLDNENLRNELRELQAQQDEENEEWSRREAELQRKIRQREIAARKARVENDTEHIFEDKPSYRREDTRTRIRSRVQQEVRNSKVASQESPRKSFTGHSRFSTRSFSAPVPADKHARAESDVESTTDLSLAPRATLRISRNPASSTRQTTMTVQPPTDLSLTELSFFPQEEIARLRRELEEQRANERASKTQTGEQDEGRHCEESTTDDARIQGASKTPHSAPPPRTLTKTQASCRHADTAADDADAEATQTRQSAMSDASMLSNTGRRRRSAPATEMTSAFILPDIKLASSTTTGVKTHTTTASTTTTKPVTSKEHDNDNCTVPRREGYTTATAALVVPKLVKMMLRCGLRNLLEALATVVKGLNDERIHLTAELAVQQAMLSEHDPSLGARRRAAIDVSIQDLMRRLSWLDQQIYRLHDVLEGQEDVITEEEVEELTQAVVNTAAPGPAAATQKEKKKKVTIRSFVSEHEVSDCHGGDDSVEFRRGGHHGKADDEEEWG